MKIMVSACLAGVFTAKIVNALLKYQEKVSEG